MSYFNEFPYTEYTFPNNESKLVKNISFKPEIIEKVKQERSAFETYILQDGDTVELVAHKLYNDINLHWAVMISNDMVSPYFDFPLSTTQFDEFIFQKYKNQTDSDGNSVTLSRSDTLAFTQFVGTATNNYNTLIGGVTAKPHHFIDSNKNRYSYDYVVNNPTKANAFNRLESDNINTFPIVSPVSIYDEEQALNEGKRAILVLKASFVNQIKNEFQRLLNE